MFEKEIEEYERIRQEYQQKIAIGLLMPLLANTPLRIAVIVIAVIDARCYEVFVCQENGGGGEFRLLSILLLSGFSVIVNST